jgi:hypothetical protein
MKRPLIAVHGFQYDPKAKGPNNPADFFSDMEGVAGRPVEGFAWYSVPFQLRAARPLTSSVRFVRGWAGAWLHGHLHPYRYAWALALKAAADLAAFLEAQPGPVDVVAHSLGSRVVLNALPLVSTGKVRRVVLFNGAELASNAEELAPRTSAAVLNIVVTCDRVLRWLGARCNGQATAWCIGTVGLHRRPHTWRDLVLDDVEVRQRARSRRGWILRSDDPADLFDHSESYRYAGNADAVRAWLDGDDLADLTR